MTVWQPDTCDCIIEFDNRIRWVSSIDKCRLHQNTIGANHLTAVLAHNRSFKLSFDYNEDTATPQNRLDLELNQELKQAERERIRRL